MCAGIGDNLAVKVRFGLGLGTISQR